MRLAFLTVVIVLGVNYACAVRMAQRPFDEPTPEQRRKLLTGELRYEFQADRFVMVPSLPGPEAFDEDVAFAAAR